MKIFHISMIIIIMRRRLVVDCVMYIQQGYNLILDIIISCINTNTDDGSDNFVGNKERYVLSVKMHSTKDCVVVVET